MTKEYSLINMLASEGRTVIKKMHIKTSPPSPHGKTSVKEGNRTFSHIAGGSIIWYHLSGRQFEARYIRSPQHVCTFLLVRICYAAVTK